MRLMLSKGLESIMQMQMAVQSVVQKHIGGNSMAVHHGGKVGKAGKTLASKTSSKKGKSKAGKILAKHKAEKH